MKLKRVYLVAILLAAGTLGWVFAPALSISRASSTSSAPRRIAAAAPSTAPEAGSSEAPAAQDRSDTRGKADDRGRRRPQRCGTGGVFCAGAATGDITPPITSPQWAYTARNCAQASAANAGSHAQDLQSHVEEGQAWLLRGGPTCVANKVSPDTDLYSKEWPATEGTFGRLQANAYVLDDGKGQRLAIIQADLGGIPGELHTYVASRVAALGIDRAHLLISATHDHGAVGGMWLGQGYALLGGDEYDPRVFTAVGTGIVNAIKQASASLTPAKMAYGFGSIEDANHNRDTGSQGLDPEMKLKIGDPVNAPRLMVMRIDTVTGVPLGVISNYANHGVIHGALNLFFSGDNQGSTTRMVSRGIAAAAAAAGVKFPAGWKVVDSLINGAVGDITPVADHGPWPDSAFHTYGDAQPYDDPNFMEFAQMENGGMRQAPEALRVWQSLGGRMSSKVTLDARFDFVCMCSQEVPDDPFDPYSHAPYVPANDDPAYNRVSTNGVLGGGGISDAPGQAGDAIKALPGPLAGILGGPCDNPVNCFSRTVVPAHHLERPTLTASAGVTPYNARVQVIRINDLALAGMPGEPTIEMGRRIERSIVKAAPAIFKNAITVGLANDYISYFPTIQEYEAYHYEGSFSLFGQQTGNVLKARLVHLAQLMQGRRPVEPCTLDRACVTPPDALAPTLQPQPLVPDLSAGAIEAQPKSIQRFGGTNFQWVGGGPGAEWDQGQAMVQVQRREASGAWATAFTDLDTEVPVHYNKSAATNHWMAYFDATRDVLPGTYRFHVSGHYATGPAATAPYTLDSSTFDITPYAGLKVVKVGPGSFEVEYPAPTPGVTYRYREKLARTATVNDTYPAVFHLNPGQVLVIPAGGIRDAWGNTNAQPVTITG
ncbi:MAG: neutral/alkaline non-lysosomal ceramidase N-terminal domain-containing protein [Candidatus Dormibacteraeota bacterium]|nr:neutral/alkaline non-lysosomal ceramidase N-terminal domain-containing protein [Candidatus Dormibacteraeota bacterium]